MYWKNCILFCQTIVVMVSMGNHEVSGQSDRSSTPAYGLFHTRPATIGHAPMGAIRTSFRPMRPITLLPPKRPSTRMPTTSESTISSTASTLEMFRPIITLRPTRVTRESSSTSSTTTTTTAKTTTTTETTTTKEPNIVRPRTGPRIIRVTRITTLTPSPTTSESTTTTTTQATTSTRYPPYQRTVRRSPRINEPDRPVVREVATPRPTRPATTQQIHVPTSPDGVRIARVTRVTTPRVDQVQYISFTLMNDFNTVFDKDKFMGKLSQAVAIAAEVRDARITNFDVNPGSIVVDFQIQPGYDWETSATDAAEVFKYNLEHMLFNFTSPEGVPLVVDPNSVKVSSQRKLTPAEVAREESMVEIKYILIVVVGTLAVALVLVLVTVLCLRNSGDKDEQGRYYRDERKISLPPTVVTTGKYRMDTASDLGFHEDEKTM